MQIVITGFIKISIPTNSFSAASSFVYLPASPDYCIVKVSLFVRFLPAKVNTTGLFISVIVRWAGNEIDHFSWCSGLVRDKMKRDRGGERFTIAPPISPAPWRDPHTHMEWHALFPTHAQNTLLPDRNMSSSASACLVLPGVRSPCAQRTDHLPRGWLQVTEFGLSQRSPGNAQWGDRWNCPYICFTENVPQGCLKTRSANSLLFLGPQGHLGSGPRSCAAAHPAGVPDSQDTSPLSSGDALLSLCHQVSRNNGCGIFLKKDKR